MLGAGEITKEAWQGMKFTRGQIVGKENKNNMMGSVDEKRITIKGLEPAEGNRYVCHNKGKKKTMSYRAIEITWKLNDTIKM